LVAQDFLVTEGTFDIVIVGAGAAGAVVAARASEDPRRSVCLVEAGPDYADLTQLPFDLVNSHNNSYTAHDWGFSYQASDAAPSAPFPRGRVVGGSSAVNTTIALRGMPEDYDGWAAAGNPEWAWERVLPAFRRMERDLDYGDRPYHGDAGPISIRRYTPAELHPVQAAFLAAAEELGYPPCADANAPWSWGAGPHPMNKLGRLRVSAAVGYLAAARPRVNLAVRAHTLTRRLIVEDGRAAAIEIERDGEVSVIRGRLIVLCAGSLQSPAILLRSGIGPRADIERLGVGLVRDVPGVGTRLCDHPALGLLVRAKDGVAADADAPIVQTLLRLTASGSADRNDLMIEPFSFALGGGNTFSIGAVLEEVKGAGVLRVLSADPHAKPVAEQRFLEDERDVARLTDCFRAALAFTQTRALRDITEEVLFPAPGRPLDDDTLAALLKRLSRSGFHPCGTLKMGPATDPGAVVDQFGRCHAVDGLVVADASLMPTVPRANIHLSTLMVGERIGEWVRTRPAQYGL
jgi:choline dehydrogenase